MLLVNNNRNKRPKTILGNSPWGIAILTSIVVFLLSLLFIHQKRDVKKTERYTQLSHNLEEIEQKFSRVFNSIHNTLLITSITFNTANGRVDFEKTAKQSITNNNYILALYLQRNHIIESVYPQAHTSWILNDKKTLLFPNPQAGLEKYTEDYKMLLTGPIKNFNGDTIIALHVPIYINHQLWGYTSALLKLSTLLNVVGISNNATYNYAISRIDPVSKREVFFISGKPVAKSTLYESMPLYDHNWKLYISLKNIKTTVSPLLILLAFIISLLTGIISFKIFNKPYKLQQVISEKDAKLAATEGMFQAVFDNAPIGLAIIDNGTSFITAVNKKFCSIFNTNKEHLLSGIGMHELIPADVFESAYSEALDVIEGRKSQITRYYKSYDENGNENWSHATVSIVPAPYKRDIKYILTTEDVTKRIEAENKIKESETRFRSLFESSPIALWEEDFSEVVTYLTQIGLMGKPTDDIFAYFDANPGDFFESVKKVKILAFNDACLRQYKLDSREELLNNFADYITSPESLHTLKLILSAICHREAKFQCESVFYDSEKNKRCSLLSWHVIEGYEENYNHVILSTVDITDLRNSQAELEGATARLRSIIDNVDGIVWTADPATLKYTFISKKIIPLTGFSQEDWANKTVLTRPLMHPDDCKEVISILEESIKNTHSCEIQYRMFTKDNSVKWCMETIDFIKDSNQKVINIIGIVVDITDLNNSREVLKESLDILHEQNKRLMNFSYIVSHNLRSHISNIQGLCDLMVSSHDLEEQNELVRSLSDVANILNNTMTGLNEVVNVTSTLDATKTIVNLKEEADYIINILKEDAQAKNATLINNIGKNVTIEFNKAYLESVLQNLISNSLKYSKHNVAPIIMLDYIEDAKHKILIFKDNGIGIDLNKHGTKLFGLFKTFTHNPDSKGIGLYITKNQIEAMGGRIEVESELNVGTTFKIFFK